MDNKELKENIVNIIKAYSNLTTGWGETVRDFILNEDDFEDVAEEIVNLLPIHNVSQRSELLIDYMKWFDDNRDMYYEGSNKEMIDEYIKSINCG